MTAWLGVEWMGMRVLVTFDESARLHRGPVGRALEVAFPVSL